MKAKLIINADDYGMLPLFNKGILELVQKNIVTSMSVLIARKHIKPEKILHFKNISVGLHLELKEKTSTKEIENQIRKFKKRLNQLPSHLDGHQHCHLTKNNLSKVIKVAKKYNLPVRSRFDEDRKIIKKAGIKTPNQFISWHPSRKEKMFQDLKNIKSGIVELACHPGYYDKKCRYPYNKQHEEELKILKGIEFKKAIGKLKLANYKKI